MTLEQEAYERAMENLRTEDWGHEAAAIEDYVQQLRQQLQVERYRNRGQSVWKR